MIMVEIYAWGKAASGQLAIGETEEELVHLPMQVPYYEGFTAKVSDIACGAHHTVFLTNDGMVYTCGSNEFGQLGHGKACSKPGKQESTFLYTSTMSLFCQLGIRFQLTTC